MKRWIVLALAFWPLLSQADEKKAAPPQGPPGTVTLSLAEYDRLVDRAAKPPKRPEAPPLPSALARAEIRFRVTGDSARGSVNLEGEVFRAGPTKVLLLSGAIVLDARLSGRALPLLSEGGAHSAILGPGPFSVLLDVAAPIGTEPGRASFLIPVPPAGSVRAVMEVPGDHTNVHVEPGLITGRSSAGGKTLIEATLNPGSTARVSWSARNSTPMTPREIRFLSDVKTLASVGEAELRVVALAEISVVQGEPEAFALRLPKGFEVTGATSSTLDAKEESGSLVLKVREPSRRHQALVSLERSVGGSFQDEVPLVSLDGAQRETGEIAVEGVGALELTAREAAGARRMDVREAHASLRALAHEPLLAAFRYHRRADEPPKVVLDVKRFPDAAVLAAVAQKAVVTTLVSSEGRTLTEVSLAIRNHAQKFVRVSLPEGTNVLSAEVAGQAVKPVMGGDGVRIPLQRVGFRSAGSYVVSFVYLQAGAPFAKKGSCELGLPPMDLPVNLLEWELFLPDRFKVKDFGGNLLPAGMLEYDAEEAEQEAVLGVVASTVSPIGAGGSAGAILGRLTDQSGASLPGGTVTLSGPASRTATSSPQGDFSFPNLREGTYRLTASLSGFKTTSTEIEVVPGQASQLRVPLSVAPVSETVEVRAETRRTDAPKDSQAGSPRSQPQKNNEAQAPSENVFALQRRVAGVLPVRVDVPRTGASYRFVRPLVLDEETKVRFSYKAR